MSNRRRFAIDSTSEDLMVFDISSEDSYNITFPNGSKNIDKILSKFRRCLMCKIEKEEVGICYLKDDNSNFYDDGTPAVLDGSDGDVMVYMPEFYYKYEKIDDSTIAYHISEHDMDGTYIKVSESLVGAYKAYHGFNYYTETLRSWSGINPSVAKKETYSAYPKLGKGFSIISYEQHCTIAMMSYCCGFGRDIQYWIGTGNALFNKNNITGSTNSIGVTYTWHDDANVGYVNLLGIEGVFGGLYEMMWGIDRRADDFDGSGKIIQYWSVYRQAQGKWEDIRVNSVNGWIKKMKFEEGPYFDMLPISAGGTDSTYYADRSYCPNLKDMEWRYVCRSGINKGLDCGVSFIDARVNPTLEYTGKFFPQYTSRLSFYGKIKEMSVQEYKDNLTHVYILDDKGNLKTHKEWITNQDVAVGIALISKEHKLLIGLNAIYGTWGKENLLVSGITTSYEYEVLSRDFNGFENTRLMIEQADSEIAKKVKEYAWPKNVNNITKEDSYIPAGGELRYLGENIDIVYLCGKKIYPENPEIYLGIYLTSSQYNKDEYYTRNCQYGRYDDGSTDHKGSSGKTIVMAHLENKI